MNPNATVGGGDGRATGGEEGAVTAARRFLRRRRWLPAVVWAVAIMVVSSLPSPSIGPPLFPGCDKIAHFIEYFILGAALSFWGGAGARARTSAAGVQPSWERASGVAWVWAGWIGFAALDEIHQRFIPGREMSFWDFAADAAGLVAGYLIRRHARCEGTRWKSGTGAEAAPTTR